LLAGQSLGAGIMDLIMVMLGIRDNSNSINWHQRTGKNINPKTQRSTYQPMRKSCFFSSTFPWRDLEDFMNRNRLLKEHIKYFVQPVKYTTHLKDHEPEDYWCAIIIDVELGNLYLLDMLGHCPQNEKSRLR